MEKKDSSLNDIMLCLGRIEGSLNTYNAQNSRQNERTTFALIGLIAAMIGVKYLGTPILLEIATVIAFISSALTVGVLILGWRLHKAHVSLTLTGMFLFVMLVIITITQIAVYFRDMGLPFITPDVVYTIRIFQNAAILSFVWSLFTEQQLFAPKKGAKEETFCGSGKGG